MSENMWERLREPFPADAIEWRVGRSGVKNNQPWAMVLAYVTNRAIMDRLDEVVGPENWWNHYAPAPVGNGILCGLTIRLPDGREVTKYDGAEPSDIEPLKGCISGAMKRAAVLHGIGRYLYGLEEGFAIIHERGRHRGEAKDPDDPKKRIRFRWDPPELPPWALPQKRENRTEREHAAMVHWIKEQAAAAGEVREFKVDGGIHPIQAYVKGNWDEVRSTYRFAHMVVTALEEALDLKFTPPA